MRVSEGSVSRWSFSPKEGTWEPEGAEDGFWPPWLPADPLLGVNVMTCVALRCFLSQQEHFILQGGRPHKSSLIYTGIAPSAFTSSCYTYASLPVGPAQPSQGDKFPQCINRGKSNSHPNKCLSVALRVTRHSPYCVQGRGLTGKDNSRRYSMENDCERYSRDYSERALRSMKSGWFSYVSAGRADRRIIGGL